jgi:hypothetical protein
MLLIKTSAERKFYILAGLFVAAGWLWFLSASSFQHGLNVCLFKAATGKPCPACGSTTALLRLTEGNWLDSLLINPLGYLAAAGLLVLPLWLLADLVTKRPSMYLALKRFDNRIRRQPFLLILILLPVILNWIWNIIKNWKQ